MKLCFSTVGCPRWRWQEIVSAASDLGYSGIEIRGVGDDLFIPEVKLFSDDNLEHLKADLAKHKLTIPCLASDALLFKPEIDTTAALHSYMSLASKLGTPFIRVLGDEWGVPGENVDEALVLARLKEIAPEAVKYGVTLLVETNGVWADSRKLKGLIETVDCPNVQVLWDINHPVRYFGETAEQTFSNIGKYVKHMHIKDSVFKDGAMQYKMLTYGDLPIRAILKAMKSIGYEGYLSMEWVKRWQDSLEEPGIVFSHYAFEMKRLINEL